MSGRTLRAAAVLLLGLAGCAAGGATSGRATGVSSLEGRVATIVVVLDAGTISGSDTVVLGFDAGEARCRDPAATIDLLDVRMGTSVTWRRLGDGVDESNPPAIRVEDVVVDC